MAFRFRLIPFTVTVALVALGISLGNWQERRAAYKTALQWRVEARAAQAPLVLGGAALPTTDFAEYRRVQATGTWVPQWAVYLDNRPYKGRSGFYVLMPLKLAGSHQHVLVARGWLPVDPANRAQIASYATPTGEVTVQGRAVASAGHVLQLGAAAAVKPGAIVQNIEPAQLAPASGLALAPFVVEQTGDAAQAGDTLVRDWPSPSFGIDKHKGYAFQWYALAVMAALFFVFTGFRRGKQ
ncbi:SURF1 family protein [Massilia arenosa]|uniref:SURF1-like protein n=1 Tax=Zemynaea arenosa TaxID=2561931 RepID=A0A4Y9SBY0_9BURK|nr:SURF1 family protein [Massilia arenosa]TFW19746.1 SURF1 family protein [Massilia arenosa]